jgi:hypothetical protein
MTRTCPLDDLDAASIEIATGRIRRYLAHIGMTPTQFIRLTPPDRNAVLAGVYWAGTTEDRIEMQRKLDGEESGVQFGHLKVTLDTTTKRRRGEMRRRRRAIEQQQ